MPDVNDPPLTEATFCILLSLTIGPRHGYAIMQDVQALSSGRVQLSTGTLYGALKRLLESGWIKRIDAASSEAGRPTKIYELTALGHAIFNTELARMRSLVAVAQQRTPETPA